jgi:hypothetical protein
MKPAKEQASMKDEKKARKVAKGEGDLNQETLEAAIIAIENYRDEDGKLVDCQGTSLVLDPAKLGEWIESVPERDPQAERKASMQ